MCRNPLVEILETRWRVVNNAKKISYTNSESISYKSRWFVVVQFIARSELAVAFRFRIRISFYRSLATGHWPLLCMES